MLAKVVQKIQKFVPKRNFCSFVNHRPSPANTESLPFEFTPENYKLIENILSKYPANYRRSGALPVLMMAQKQNDNFLSLSAMKKVAKILEMPEMEIFEVASFYTMYNREKVGKFHLQVCGTTPCMVRGAENIIKTCEKHLGIHSGETTADGLFTIQEVECLGACANAPMIQINGEWVYEDLTPENTIQLIEDLKAGKEVKKGPQNSRVNAEGELGRTTLKDFNPENVISRDFSQAKEAWAKQKEAERAEAEAKKAQAQAQAAGKK